MKSDNRKLFEQLRKKHPSIVYDGFSCALDNNSLYVVFEFFLKNGPSFRPEIRIPLPTYPKKNILSDSLIRNIIFNMGMVELISYWKAACSPEIVINASGLEDEQKKWWKKLFRFGLGEFFYENGIDPDEDFVEIRSVKEMIGREGAANLCESDILVPIGGGKDSVVTLEILGGEGDYPCRPIIINPREASLQTASKAGYADYMIINVSRSIDPELLALNEKGYLNGHTPFSAMLAFTSLLVAAVYQIKEIALSNESSANEPSIPGTGINHQYSKSLEFEQDFRHYVKEHICEDFEYYSFLRPLNELQISGLFARYTKHHPTFRSCNVGSKSNSWCGECPKCLFTFIMLSVFLENVEVIKVFGENLYDKESLATTFDQLCGFSDEKPFECVGTIDEVNMAVEKLIDEYGNDELPFLLKRYVAKSGAKNYDPGKFRSMLNAFDENQIPDPGKIELLKRKISAL